MKIIRFMELRDQVLAGQPDKDRRHGEDVIYLKSFLQSNRITLGQVTAMEKLHDRFLRIQSHKQLRQILVGV